MWSGLLRRRTVLSFLFDNSSLILSWIVSVISLRSKNNSAFFRFGFSLIISSWVLMSLSFSNLTVLSDLQCLILSYKSDVSRSFCRLQTLRLLILRFLKNVSVISWNSDDLVQEMLDSPTSVCTLSKQLLFKYFFSPSETQNKSIIRLFVGTKFNSLF